MSKTKGHIPIRTCIVCRSKKEKKRLLRLVLDSDGWVVVDRSGYAPGRGAYVCKDKECWAKLEKSKALARAFRSRGRLALSPKLREDMPSEMKE